MFTDSTLFYRPGPGQAVFSLPGLNNALPLGGGCCVMAADDAVRNELISWPGIASASVDLVAETANVTLDPAVPDQLEYVAEALRDLGFEKVEIVRPA